MLKQMIDGSLKMNSLEKPVFIYKNNDKVLGKVIR